MAQVHETINELLAKDGKSPEEIRQTLLDAGLDDEYINQLFEEVATDRQEMEGLALEASFPGGEFGDPASIVSGYKAVDSALEEDPGIIFEALGSAAATAPFTGPASLAGGLGRALVGAGGAAAGRSGFEARQALKAKLDAQEEDIPLIVPEADRPIDEAGLERVSDIASKIPTAAAFELGGQAIGATISGAGRLLKGGLKRIAPESAGEVLEALSAAGLNPEQTKKVNKLGLIRRDAPPIMGELRRQKQLDLGREFPSGGPDQPASTFFPTQRVATDEEALVINPAIGGTGIKNKFERFAQGVLRLADEVRQAFKFGINGQPATKANVGKVVKDHLRRDITLETTPLSEKYNKLTERLKDTPSFPTENLELLNEIRQVLLDEHQMAVIGDKLTSLEKAMESRLFEGHSVESLRQLRSDLQRNISDRAFASDEEVYAEVAQKIIKQKIDLDILKSVGENRTQQEAIALRNELTEVNKAWAIMSEEISALMKDLTSRQKPFRGVPEVKKFLDNLPEDKIANFFDKLWRNGSFDQIETLRGFSPESYEILKQYQLDQLFRRASADGQGKLLNGFKLVEEIEKLSDASAQMLFGGSKREAREALKNLKTLHETTSPKLRPLLKDAQDLPGAAIISKEKTPTGEVSQILRAGRHAFEVSIGSKAARAARNLDELLESLMPFKPTEGLKRTVRGDAVVVPLRVMFGPDTTESLGEGATVGGFKAENIIALEAMDQQVPGSSSLYGMKIKNAARGKDPTLPSIEAAKALDLFNRYKFAVKDLITMPGRQPVVSEALSKTLQMKQRELEQLANEQSIKGILPGDEGDRDGMLQELREQRSLRDLMGNF